MPENRPGNAEKDLLPCCRGEGPCQAPPDIGPCDPLPSAENDARSLCQGRHPSLWRKGALNRPCVSCVEAATKSDARSTCGAGMDGDCYAGGCPQRRDGEPARTGRFCPLPTGNAWQALRESDERPTPPAAADPVLAFVERVEGRLEAMSADAPGYYDDVIRVLRDEAQTRVLPPGVNRRG